jgi:hypothetical protein
MMTSPHTMKVTLAAALAVAAWAGVAKADADYERALKRSTYLLSGTLPTDEEQKADGSGRKSYVAAVRRLIDGDGFYDAMIRYHERLFGTGLRPDYIDELQDDDIDSKEAKFAEISCDRGRSGTDDRMRCHWPTKWDRPKEGSGCPTSWEQPISVFWYPSVVAWACPTVIQACGADLSRCFVRFQNEDQARNAELGASEIFDSRAAVVKSLSRQSAGLAAAVVVGNYPYTKILEPGLSAVDGAVAHFLRQPHHFDLGKLHIPDALKEAANEVPLTQSRFVLVNGGPSYEQGGVLTTFGWLRRYEKNRSRAKEVYERLLCRSFTSELPRVFPQDPGNLRETPGCSGCHSTLDPMADFFTSWGEGGDLYVGGQGETQTSFGGRTGSTVTDFANIVREDRAFATCSVQNAWEWLMGREFYQDEEPLRSALTDYFVTTDYSFRELVYAIATHPGYVEGLRGDALVGDPIEQPTLGASAGGGVRECSGDVDFDADIAPSLNYCTSCHGSDNSIRQDLSTEAQWRTWGSQAVSMMASGTMPPGQAGPPLIGPIFELKEAVRCWLEQQ